jgi:anti-sigma B factor antagonist
MVGDDRLSVEVVRDDADECLVHVEGEIDFGSAPDLRVRLHQMITSGAPRLVLDVSGVTFCDSSGLGVLVGARSLLLARGGTLAVVGATGQVDRLLRITGLERLFTPGALAATPPAEAAWAG